MPNEEDKKVGEDDESTVDTTPDDNPLTDEEKGDGLDTEDKEEKFMNPNELPPGTQTRLQENASVIYKGNADVVR